MGADIDRLEVQVEAEAKDANKQLDDLAAKLGLVAKALSSITNMSGFKEITTQSKQVAESMGEISAQTQSVSQAISKSMAKATKPMEEVRKSASEIAEKYKDLGKDFQFFGSAESAQKQTEKYSNALETAKLKKAELEATGKTEGKMYENAIKDIQKYSNMIDALKAKTENTTEYQPQWGSQEEFDEWRETLPSAKKQTEEMADVVKKIGDQAREFTGEWGGIEIPSGFLKTENLIDRMKTHIQQMMNGMRIEDPIDVSALTDEEWDIFQRLKEEAHSSAESVKQSFEHIEEPIRESFVLASEPLKELDLTLANFSMKATQAFDEPQKESGKFSENLQVLKDVANGIQERFLELKGRLENTFVSKGLKIYTSEYVELQNQITKTEKTLATLNAQMARSRATVGNFEGTTSYRKMQYDIAQATAELQRLRNEQDKLETSGGATQWNFKGLSDGAKSSSKTLQPLYNTLKKVSDAASSLAKKILSVVSPFKKLKNQANGFHGSLSDGLKTILKYGIGIRSLYVLFNKLRSAIAEGMKNLVQYSNETNYSVSTLSSSLTQLKNASAAMVSPLLNALAPALNQLIQMFVSATNAVNQFFAALTGQSTWIKAKYVYEDVADSISSATQAAKGALQPFDALNNLTTQDSSGAGAAPSDMFETLPIESQFKDLADWIKDMWDNADFYDLGRKIGEEIQHALANVPWDSIKDTARKLGKSLATLINGFVEVEGLGEAIGYSIAQALNTAFEFANSFVHTLHWDSIGKFIAETINGFTQNIDWALIRDTLITGAKGLADAINSFVDYLDWDSVAETISNAVNALSDTVIMFFERTDWSELGHKVGYTLEKTIEDIDFEDVGRAIADVIQAALDFSSGFIAELDWNEIKSAIKDLFSGFFGNIEIPENLKGVLELLLGIKVATAGIGTAIKTAKVAKGFNDIVKAGKSLKNLGIAKIFSGIQDVFSVFSTSFSEFTNSFSISGDLFASFKNGLSTLKTGLNNFSSSLSPVTKGVVGLTTVFTEFKVVGNAFDDIINGTRSLVGSIGKITAAVGAASGVLSFVFGVPAGIIIAGVTAAVAGLKSLNDHFNELEVERVGERIKESLSNPGGVSLDIIADQYADAFAELRGQFTNISDQASNVDMLDDSIINVYQDIDKIRTSMENGVISVEEGTEQLKTLFSDLEEITAEKFGAIEDTLYSAFGEGGAYHDALEEMGVNTQEALAKVSELSVEVQDELRELNEYQLTLDPLGDEWQEVENKKRALTGGLDEMTGALNQFQYDINSINIDYSGVLGDSGAFNEKLSTDLASLTESAATCQESIGQSSVALMNTLQEAINSASEVGNTELQEYFENLQSIIGDAGGNMNSQVAEVAKQLTDRMQSDWIDAMDEQIMSAQEEWGKLDPLDKFWLNMSQGISSESEYVKKQLDEYKTNTIDPAAQQIEDTMAQLGIDGAGWADEALEKMMESLFNTEIHYGVGIEYTLSDDWKTILENTKANVIPTAEETGGNIGEGIVEGLQKTDIVSATQSLFNAVDQNIRSVFGIHSPASTMIPLGNNVGLGIVEGFSQGTASITTKIQELLSKFSSIAEPLRQAGVNAMQGFANGISSMAGTILSSARSIADNVTSTIKSALSIHSPSRVMFELGDYTMQGFQNGIESLYQPIISSIRSFGEDVQIAPAPSMESLYGNYQFAYAGIPDYNTNSYIDNSYSNDNSETNTLLRELLSVVREGKVIEMNGSVVGKTLIKEDDEYYKRTGKGMFQH